MNGWKHESINLYVVKCPNLITTLLPWYGLQSRWGGGAGRTKKSAFVSSIEIGSDTGLFPPRSAALLWLQRPWHSRRPCRSQENNHAKNANKLDGEIDIRICAICVWFYNHPYSEFAGQSHVYLFLMFPMTMPS